MVSQEGPRWWVGRHSLPLRQRGHGTSYIRTFQGLWGTVDSVVCQKSYDYPDEVSPGYHIALEDGKRVTLRWDQVV